MACEYIYIYKGDDTDWNDEQLITVNVTSGSPLVDLTDMTATFILGSYEKKNISLESGSFQIDLGAAVTGDFPYGAIMGIIKILDSQKRVRTVANMIPFYVTNEVITLQNQNLVIDVPQVSINLTVGGTVNYNNLSNKPSINGLTVEGAHEAAYYDLATKTALDAHIADVNNPHEVTKEQVGLGNVDNTADTDKPISTATQSALNTKMPLAGGTFTGNVAFANGTKIEFPTFDIYNDDGLAIIEGTYGLRVDTTSGLGAVLKTVNGTEKIITDNDVKSTYSATGTDPVNGTAVASAVAAEATLRENSDNGLQSQIDALSAASDVTDIVGTYAELQAYDTSKLKDNDIIKVLSDSTHNNASTYYRWSTHTHTFTYIGAEGPYYTKSEADGIFATQNALSTGLAAKQDTLTAGTGISIEGNVISATGSTPDNVFTTDNLSGGQNITITTEGGGGYKINCTLAPSLTWYSGTRGNTLTIADTSSAHLVKIYKNGVLMQESADYTISGTTLTMDVSLVETDKIALEVI